MAPVIARTYALYAWGNYIGESGLDRVPAWLEPAVLSGEQTVVDDYLLTFVDEEPLPVGEIVTVWQDENGQWDLALVRI